jgi:hypothetical protein
VIDLIVKLLIIIFAFVVVGCFAFWPQELGRIFNRWRGPGVEPAEPRGANLRKTVETIWFRQIGVLLITLTAYVVYLWISMAPR